MFKWLCPRYQLVSAMEQLLDALREEIKAKDRLIEEQQKYIVALKQADELWIEFFAKLKGAE
jgi:hypothetical protein